MSGNKVFDTLLVANRGEIAIRVLRAARRLGLRTVAVYSDADRGSPHLAEADQAVRIGPAPASRSYLSIEAILAAADASAADALHPGYGFLAESASFAAACESAGLVFVGPQPEVIELMSRKDRAREVARAAGASVVPAVGESTADELAARVGEEVGFPALVKAVAGGGGKGMRVVRRPAELAEALAAAAREASSAFGDGAVLVERYLPEGRHLEVQLVGDGRGKVVHLLDRDCSVQRRHQKVVEEAPASTVHPAARERARSAAVALGSSVRYRSLGTMEFLAVGEEAYFLEMNTRLQVEHPVTELVTGIDLVELQLRLAAGEPLDLGQEDVVGRGHAIEARVYAEDAAAGFLPQSGRATFVRWPSSVRVDAALEAGQEVGTDYDPMLAKVVAGAPTREAARRRLVDALDDTAIFGLTTNLGFLRRLVDSEPFARAEIHTSWLDERAGELGTDDPEPALAAAAVFLAERLATAAPRDPFAADGWRVGADPAPTVIELAAGGTARRLAVETGCRLAEGSGHGLAAGVGRRLATAPRWIVHEGERRLALESVRIDGDELSAEVDGVRERFFVRVEGRSVLVAHRGALHRFEPPSSLAASGGRVGSEGALEAPLPGVLATVRVAAGDLVAAGEVLGVLESMKMEYPLRARSDGRVTRVAFGAGAKVARGDVLFELDPEPFEPGPSPVLEPEP